MPYIKDYNILYVHAPRTEDSIHKYFTRKCKIPLDTGEARTLRMFRDDVNPYTLILGSVQNPYTWVLYDLYATHVINPSMSGEEVEGLLLAFLTAKSPQYTYFINEEGVIDPSLKVVKHESLEHDMTELGFESFKGDKHHDSYDQLTLKSVEAINEKYAKDFEYFGYQVVTTQEQLESMYTPGKQKQISKLKRETPREIPRETPREIPRKAPREKPRETPRQAPREIPRETPREMPRQAPREIPRETPREMPRQAPREMPLLHRPSLLRQLRFK
jgi:hypothetical protein